MIVRSANANDASALARIMIDGNVHAFSGRVPEQCLRWITPEESERNWCRTIDTELRGPEILLVADERSEVIGFALARLLKDEPGYDAELRIMAVAPAHQRRGIGRSLLQHVGRHLSQHGVHSMLVRVLEVNPNVLFYRRLGAQFIRNEPHEWNGVPLVMSVYGWADLTALNRPAT